MFFAIQGKMGIGRTRCGAACFRCIVFETAMELLPELSSISGLGWRWDYSDQPFQPLRADMPAILVIFSGLCVLGILLSGYLTHWLYGDEKPHYHVL